MSNAGALRVAVVGASSLIGEAVIDELRARKMAFAELHALDDERSVGRAVDGEEGAESSKTLPVSDVAAFDFSRVDLVFFCGRSALSERYAEAAAAHAWVIDGSAAFRARADVPLVVADVNAAALQAVGARGLIALPGSASVALATVLAPLHALAGLERAEVATYQAVSGSGRGAMDELAGETVAMLSGKKARGTGLWPADRVQCDPAGRCSWMRMGCRARSGGYGRRPAGCSDLPHLAINCHGGAGAGVLRPQPGGAREF